MFSLQASDRLVVIAPHPDDETLGVGGIIYQARQQGIPVTVIFLSSGDGNRVGVIQWAKRAFPKPRHYQLYARMREQEAIQALAVLGVARSAIHFLGFPDQGIKRLLSKKYQHFAFRSRYTKVSQSVTGLTYTGESARESIRTLLETFVPTTMLIPMIEDSHTDHRAGGKLSRQVGHSFSPSLTMYAYPIHYRRFPKPRGMNNHLPLAVPRHHPRADDWHIVPLSEEAITAKLTAVNCYVSQLEIPLLKTLMLSLVRSNELLLPLS